MLEKSVHGNQIKRKCLIFTKYLLSLYFAALEKFQIWSTFCFVLSHICTEYGENKDQKVSKFGHFLRRLYDLRNFIVHYLNKDAPIPDINFW